MKQLILVRHAKSSWKEPGLDDHDRPLNKRGERDAPYMAAVLNKKKVKPGLLVSSSAERAHATAKAFRREFDLKKADLVKQESLYLADVADLVECIGQLPDSSQTVLLFGHNPGITLLVNHLADAGIDNVPTCGICSIAFDMDEWKKVAETKGELQFFEFPKKYFRDADD